MSVAAPVREPQVPEEPRRAPASWVRARLEHPTYRGMLQLGLAYVLLFALASLFFRGMNHIKWEWDIPQIWPLSIFLVQLPLGAIGWLAAAVLAGLAAVALRPEIRRHMGLIALVAVAAILAGSLTRGYSEGLYQPVYGLTEGAAQYYNDVHRVEGVRPFLAAYNEIQPTLTIHSRTHPPGPVLAMYAGDRLFGNPAAVGVAIALPTLVLSCFMMFGLLRRVGLEERTARWLTLIFALLPAVQIYYLFSIDGLIATLALALLWSQYHERDTVKILLGGAAAFGLMMLSFGTVLPVAAALLVNPLRNRSIAPPLLAAALAGLAILAMVPLFGYNYLQSFLTASRLENPDGFRGLATPMSYVFTRIENVAEPLLFLGPALGLLLVFSLVRREWKASPETKLMALAIAGQLLIFLTGALRTGETARACLYLVPFIVLGLAPIVSRLWRDERSQTVVLAVVVFQLVVMQVVGNYYW
jgi:hypothetical protein